MIRPDSPTTDTIEITAGPSRRTSLLRSFTQTLAQSIIGRRSIRTATQPQSQVAPAADSSEENRPDSREKTVIQNDDARRAAIQKIMRDQSKSQKQKNMEIQQLMNPHKPAREFQQPSPGAQDNSESSRHHDHRSYKSTKFKCTHYQAENVSIFAECCQRWFPCRVCHNESQNHDLKRGEITLITCKGCGTDQQPSQQCTECDTVLGTYHCGKCSIWENLDGKHIYHCDACGMCRLGKGLGIDFFHCTTCNVCLSIEMQDNHKCIENSLHSDCSICGEYMFDSRAPVEIMVNILTSLRVE